MSSTGLMNKLRDKTHIILIILVIAFIGTIVFEWGMDYLGMRGGNTQVFGSVNGEEIDYNKFNQQVDYYIQQQQQQTGETPDEAMMGMIRNQIWEQMVQQVLITQEINKLGITVSDAEIKDWVYNSPLTLPDVIKQNFIDSTKNFNMAMYQQVLTTQTPEIQKFWLQVEDYLRETLLNQKLQSVISGSVRINESDVLQKYKDDKILASFDYIFLPITAITDNQIAITDDDLNKYYNKNKDDFRSEETVKMKYILFSDQPTKDDTAQTIKELQTLRKTLAVYDKKDTTVKDFINGNSVQKYSDTYLKANELSSEVSAFLFGCKGDSTSNVIIANDGYTLVRYLDSKQGENTYVNAQHILINFGADTNAAKQKAELILKRIRDGKENFNKVASEVSDDPGSKVKGGDLGWFTKGAMVKEFEDACFNNPVGSIVGVIKSQFGFHIIKVNQKESKEFKALIIKKTVKASQRTIDLVRKRAEDFTYISKNSSFDEEAKKLNLQVLDIASLPKNGFVPNAGQNSSVHKFAFNEDKGSISEPIKIQTGYAVYLLVDKIPAGFTPFETIKDNVIRPKLALQKKLDMLSPQAKELKDKLNGDINNVKNINNTIMVLVADTMTAAKPNPNIGTDPEFNKIVFSMQNGQLSEPIRTDRGYYIVRMRNITPFDQKAYNEESRMVRDQLLSQKKQSLAQEWLTELKEHAEIIDNRDKYFR